MARDSRVTGVFYLGDVVCVGDASMVSSAFYPWNVMWMSDAWWLFDVMPSGNVFLWGILPPVMDVVNHENVVGMCGAQC